MTGSLYRPTYAPRGMTRPQARAAGMLQETDTWWCSYFVGGRRIRESTGTTKRKEAERYLATRTGAAATGRLVPRLDRIH
jgi:hypothetical protein